MLFIMLWFFVVVCFFVSQFHTHIRHNFLGDIGEISRGSYSLSSGVGQGS